VASPPARSAAASRAPRVATRQLALSLSVGAALLAGLGAWLWNGATTGVRDEAAAAAYAAARELGDEASAVRLVDQAALFPASEHVWSWSAHGEALSRGHEAFARAAQLHQQASVRLIVPETAAGFAAPGERTAQRFFATVASEPKPAWLAPVNASPGLRAAWESGRGQHQLEEGTGLVTTWAPIHDAHGHAIAVLELTRPAAQPLAAARKEAMAVLGGVALVLAALAAGLWRLARAQDHEVARDRAAIRRLLRGERAEAASASGALTAELESLRETLVAEQIAAAACARELQCRLQAAESLLAPGLLARRKAIAARIGAHRLLLRVGEAVAEEVSVVDLSYGHVTIRTGELSAVDLAPGMPVSVGWNKERPNLCELWVRRRIETDDGVHYLLGGVGDMELPGTPSALRATAYPSRSERALMGPGEAEARFADDALNVGPLTLLDLSACGMQLLLPLALEEASLLGTRHAFLLSLPGAETPLALEAQVKRVSAIEAGTTFDVEFLTTSANLDATRRLGAWVSERLRSGRSDRMLSAA
jgi:hypothetical protein